MSSGALNTEVLGVAGVSRFEGGRHYCHYPLPQFALRPIYREGTEHHASAENWIKDLLSMAQPEQDPFSPQPVPPIRRLHKPPILIHQRERENENHSHRKLTKLITWITAPCNSKKL